MCTSFGEECITIKLIPTLTVNRPLLHFNQWLDYYIAICHYHPGYWPWPHPLTDQYFILYRFVLYITTDIELRAKELTPTLTINRSLLHSSQWLDYYFITIGHYHWGYWPDPTPKQISTSFPIRYVLSITTDIGLPAKFDTLAIVSILLPESYTFGYFFFVKNVHGQIWSLNDHGLWYNNAYTNGCPMCTTQSPSIIFKTKNKWQNLEVCNNSKMELNAYTNSNRMRTP